MSKRRQWTKEARQGMKEVMKLPGNERCADCRAKHPDWASLNLGVIICMECSGCHRGLGVHISKVRSTKIDVWEGAWVRKFKKMGGNTVVNSIYQAKLKGRDAIGPDCSSSERADFIRSKYDYKEFMTKKARRKSFNLQKEAMRAARRRDDSSDDSDSGSSSGSDSSNPSSSDSSNDRRRRRRKRGKKTRGAAKKKESKRAVAKVAEKVKKISVADDDDEWANFDESFDAAKTPAKRATQSASTNGAIDIFNIASPGGSAPAAAPRPAPTAAPVATNPTVVAAQAPAPAASNGINPLDIFGDSSAKPERKAEPQQKKKTSATNDIMALYNSTPPQARYPPAGRGMPMMGYPPAGMAYPPQMGRYPPNTAGFSPQPGFAPPNAAFGAQYMPQPQRGYPQQQGYPAFRGYPSPQPPQRAFNPAGMGAYGMQQPKPPAAQSEDDIFASAAAAQAAPAAKRTAAKPTAKAKATDDLFNFF